MKYNRLGNTGLQVSELCFGTMTFSGANFLGGVIGKQGQTEATQLIGRALEAHINFIDTADVYSIGESEILTGQALKDLGARRSDIVLATKVFARMGPGPNDIGASRGHIMDGVARSLERLQTDYIDLYQIHQADIGTGVEETMRALDDLVSQRMVRYVGVSNYLGGKFTADRGAFAPVLAELAARGLGYLDDGSSPRSLVRDLAPAAHIRSAVADVVIDANPTPEAIEAQLARLEALARKQDGVIGVATALPVSLDHIAHWAATLESRGLALAPVSALLTRPAATP